MTASMYHSLLMPPKLAKHFELLTLATCADNKGNCHGSSHEAEEWIADKDNKSLVIVNQS